MVGHRDWDGSPVVLGSARTLGGEVPGGPRLRSDTGVVCIDTGWGWSPSEVEGVEGRVLGHRVKKYGHRMGMVPERWSPSVVCTVLK